MRCKKCGREVSDNSIFCINCGEKVEKSTIKVCKKCGKENEDIYMFCSGCGSLLDNYDEKLEDKKDQAKVVCKNCGNETNEDSAYCQHCGKNPNEEMKNYCPNCGILNPNENNYCLRCGSPLKKDKDKDKDNIFNKNNKSYDNIHIKPKIKTSVSLILGIIAILLAPGVATIVLSILSIVYYAKEKETHPKEQRIVGLVLSIIALFITFIRAILFILSLIYGPDFDVPGYFY